MLKQLLLTCKLGKGPCGRLLTSTFAALDSKPVGRMYLVGKRLLILMSALLFAVAMTTTATASGQARHKSAHHANLDASSAIRQTTTKGKIATFEVVYEEKDKPPLPMQTLSTAETLPVSSFLSQPEGYHRSSRHPRISPYILSSVFQL